MTKKVKLIVSVIGILIIILFLYQYNIGQLKQLGSEYFHGNYLGKESLKEFQKDGAILSTIWQLEGNAAEDESIKAYKDTHVGFSVAFGKQYLVKQNVRLKTTGHMRLNATNDSAEYWTLDIYELNDLKKKPRTIDLLNDFQEKDAVAVSVISSIFYDENRQEFILVEYLTKDRDSFFNVINLKDQTVTRINASLGEIYNILGYDEYIADETNLLNGTNLVDKFLAQGLMIAKSGRMIYPNSNRVSNKYFKELFSKVNGEFTEDYQVFVLVDNIPDLLENYEKFFDTPEEIYRDLLIEADYSIDGQEHTVQTKEEFLKYYRTPQEDS